MVLFPNAKINLGLDVLTRRTDGYHDISTVMVPIPLTDVLEILPSTSSSDSLHTTGNNIECPVEKNLVCKAIRALRKLADVPPVEIHLHKIIPDGAGLGGGSSDASFTLTGLNRMFNLGIDKATLKNVAASIGADCPFFIDNVTALCTGIGEIITPINIDLNGIRIIIVKPSIGIQTAGAYSRITPEWPATPLEQRLSDNPGDWQDTVSNVFENALLPDDATVISDIKRRLIDAGAFYASMSGSGSAVYGLFDSDNRPSISRDDFGKGTFFYEGVIGQ